MSVFTRTDVTAVKLYQNYILSGIGSYVNIYDKASARLLQRIEGLKGQKIYGFVRSKCGEKMLIFGGKQFAVLAIITSDTCVELKRIVDPILCDDWLHSAVWVDQDTVTFLTAHNVVQKWSLSNKIPTSSQHSKDNSILYSGLLLPVQNDIVVFAGTVFSIVIVYRCGRSSMSHHLEGHRGVIFSISCDPQKEIIVTTSDDRSIRVWQINNKSGYPKNTVEYWDNITIECRNEVYGHTARVMRNLVTDKLLVSIGEDSAICYWSFEGILLRKVESHQNATIWSLDADEQHLVTGGGDGGITLHPLQAAADYSLKESLNIIDYPKTVLFTARRNIAVINENNDLVYYDVAGKIKSTQKLCHESTYKMVDISTCRELIAICDMAGKVDIFRENTKEPYLINILDTNVCIGKLRSLQFVGDRHLVFCNEDGNISVFEMKDCTLKPYGTFTLPHCKEKWLTTCAIDFKQDIFICSDRCGNLHLFKKQESKLIKTWKKATGRYGATSILLKNDLIITTGRDGHVKTYKINLEDATESNYLSKKEIKFPWVERFLDSEMNLLCGFQERTFIVFNMKTNTKTLEFDCGGGHRSWDVIYYSEQNNCITEECIKMIYLKNSTINLATFELSKIVPRNIVNGSQSKNIICLKTYKTDLDSLLRYYISGGEDTTVRLSSVNREFTFEDLVTYRHLSNIRTLKIYPRNDSRLLSVSAGGRAQFCVNEFKFKKSKDGIKVSSQELANYMIKGSDLSRRKNKTNENYFDPETRIMDLDAIHLNEDTFIIFAGCSDAYLRAFKYTKYGINEFKIDQTAKTCILKVQHINILNKDLLITCTTRGEITLWNVIELTTVQLEAIFTIRPHQCGINCIAYKNLSDKILLATGGDDNSIHVNLLEIKINTSKPNDVSIKMVHKWSTTHRSHSSQITGLALLDNIMVSTSIDQRVTSYSWEVTDEGIRCEFLSQVYSDVADIQGLDIVEATRDSVTVCVFGKGMEVINIPRK